LEFPVFLPNGKKRRMQLLRGFKIVPGSKLMLCEDVVTNRRIGEGVIELNQKEGAEVLAVGSVVNRSSQPVDFGVPFRSLIKMEVLTHQPASCPFMRTGYSGLQTGSKVIKSSSISKCEH